MKNSGVVATVWANFGDIVIEPCDGVPVVIRGKFEDMNLAGIAEVETEINRRIQHQVPFVDASGVPHVVENPVTEPMILAVNDAIAREFSDVLMMITLRTSELQKVLASQQ